MPTRVAHIIETLGHGGAEHELSVLAKNLDRAHYESVVVHLYPPGFLAEPLRRAGIEVHGLDAKRSPRNWPRSIRALRRLLQSLKPDLIHTHLFEADVVGGVAARSLGLPVVSSLCNIGGEDIRLVDNPRYNRFKLVSANLLWSATLHACHRHVIAISKAVKKSAMRTYRLPPSRISVVYRANPVRPPGRDEEGLKTLRKELAGDGHPVFLNVGRLAPQKGQRYLVEAMASVRARHPKAVLLIVGSGWLGEALETRARRLGVSDAIRLLGRREDVPDVFRTADAFVFPSLFEGLGVSLLEAAAAGLPCITSNVGPMTEIVRHEETGLLVPPRAPRALAEAMIRLADEPAFARTLGRAAASNVRTRFTIDRMAKDTQAVYTRVLGG